MSDIAWRPRRSCLYVPASNAKALEKAPGLRADMILIDLEDAVAVDAKPEAREVAAQKVAEGAFSNHEVLIRINGMDTEWGGDDLKVAAAAGPAGILVPKVSTPEEVARLDDAMTEAGFPDEAALWVMIETPRAVLELATIAATAQATRLFGFVLGLNDLGKDTGMRTSEAREAFRHVLAQTVLAARAYGLHAIDAVYNSVRDSEGFAEECAQARRFGFDGKSVIHPAQIEMANTMFSPAPEEVVFAREVIETFEAPENEGKGALTVDGRMVERLHYEESKVLMAHAEIIEARKKLFGDEDE